MIKVTLTIPAGAPAGSGATQRFFPNEGTMVCVEPTPGIHEHKAASTLVPGDKLCMFSSPKPGPGVLIDTVEVL